MFGTLNSDSDRDSDHTELNLGSLPRHIELVSLESLENKNPRFHFQVPYGWTQTMINSTLAKFGAIDYIIYSPMYSGPGLTGIIQYIYELDAKLAQKNEFCSKTLEARPAEPRTLKPNQTLEDIYEKHETCGH